METKLRDIPGRIYLRYLLLTIPGVVILILVLTILEHWVAMPAWLFWADHISVAGQGSRYISHLCGTPTTRSGREFHGP